MRLRKLVLRVGSGVAMCASAHLFAANELSEQAVSPVTTTTPQRAIKHNPFTKPDFSQRSEQAEVEEQTAVPQALLHLRAVLYSSTTPLVNINGRILAEGDEIDGFLLQEVIEDGAILSKDEVQIMLSMTQE